jgi:Mn-containing catalase
MYHHIKKLMYTVNVGTPDPRFGNMLLEQFGGANGELAAAMQYSIQGLNCDDPDRKDMLMDIGTEELSHLEIVDRRELPEGPSRRRAVRFCINSRTESG